MFFHILLVATTVNIVEMKKYLHYNVYYFTFSQEHRFGCIWVPATKQRHTSFPPWKTVAGTTQHRRNLSQGQRRWLNFFLFRFDELDFFECLKLSVISPVVTVFNFRLFIDFLFLLGNIKGSCLFISSVFSFDFISIFYWFFFPSWKQTKSDDSVCSKNWLEARLRTCKA